MKMKMFYSGAVVKARPMLAQVAEIKYGIMTTGKRGHGYLVEYPDGYRTWLPKDVFEHSFFSEDSVIFKGEYAQ